MAKNNIHRFGSNPAIIKLTVDNNPLRESLLGPAWLESETQTKWEKALCNQFAVACFKGEG